MKNIISTSLGVGVVCGAIYFAAAWTFTIGFTDSSDWLRRAAPPGRYVIMGGEMIVEKYQDGGVAIVDPIAPRQFSFLGFEGARWRKIEVKP